MKTLKEIKVGDLFYTQFNDLYYFLQIVHTNNDTSPSNGSSPKYGYFIVVFEKAYNELPKSIEDLDLINVYKINPEIFKYEDILEFNIRYFGNTKVLKQFCPSNRLEDFALPTNLTETDEGIKVLNDPDLLEHIFFHLKYENKKRSKKINLKYFPEWVEYVDMNKITKIEKIIAAFENNCNKESAKKSLKKCIVGINKLDAKDHFLHTTEREDLYEKLMNISMEMGISEKDAEKIIEDNRDW